MCTLVYLCVRELLMGDDYKIFTVQAFYMTKIFVRCYYNNNGELDNSIRK